MPKLTRLHIAGLGHRDAKFNPLGLKFTNARNTPVNSLLWLPNGGGKSLLIAFKYALLRPHKRDFLCQRTGRNADLDDFIEPGKLAIVLLELDFSETGMGRRILGYAAVRKEQGLERTFFSFHTHPCLAWESLPILGLGQPAASITKLLEYFRSAAKKDDARINFFETPHQSEWIKHLRDDVKLDPEIFSHHLVMNSDEGGVTKVFAKKTTDEFIQLFLQLALENEAIYRINEQGDRVDQVRELLTDYKTTFHQNPKRELTRDLCNELLPILKQVLALVERRKDLSDQLVKTENDAAFLLRAIADKQEELRQKVRDFAEEITTLNGVIADLKQTKQRNAQWLSGYEVMMKRLRFEETEEQLINSRTTHTQAQRQTKVLRAAHAGAVAQAADVALNAIVKERDAKLAAFAPALDTIKQIGGKLAFILSARKAELSADSKKLNDDQSAANRRLADAEAAIKVAENELVAIRKSRTKLQEYLADLKFQRQKLRNDGLIDEKETAVIAAKRWKDTVFDLESSLGTIRSEREDWLGRAESATNRETSSKIRIGLLTSERTSAQNKLSEWKAKVSRFRSLPAVQAISGGTEISVWNDSLAPALGTRISDARANAINVRIANNDDERTTVQYQPPDKPLFPAPLDVEIVRRLLKKHGIESVDAYAHLDAQFQQTSDAEAQMRTAPIEWSGVVVQSVPDFERARKLVQEASISRPVAVLCREWLTSPQSSASPHRHVVVPTARGMWNRKMAQADIHVVRQRHEQAKDVIAQADERCSENEEALRMLRQLQQEKTKEQVDALEGSISTLESEIGREEITRREAENEKSLATQSAAELLQRSKTMEIQLNGARAKEVRIREHVVRYEDRAEGWMQEDAELEREENKRIDLKSEAERNLHSAEEALKEFPGRRQQLMDRGVVLQADGQRLKMEYLGPATEPRKGETADTLWPVYESEIRSYEGNTTDENLKFRLEHARGAKRDADTALATLSKGLNQAEWSRWLSVDNLPAKIEEAQTEEQKAFAELGLAQHAHEMAIGAWPESMRGGRSKETIDPSRVPTNSVAAEYFADQCRGAFNSAEQQREENDTRVNEISTMSASFKELIPMYGEIAAKAPEGLAPADTGKHRDFVGEIGADKDLAKRVFDAVRAQRVFVQKSDAALRDLFETQWAKILQNETYTKKDLEIRNKVSLLGRTEIEHDPQKHIKTITGIRDACDNELTQLATQRASLVQHLVERAKLALKRLKALQTESYLPKDLDAWGGNPFLKVDIKITNDEVEQSRKLSDLVDRWAREGDASSIPAGHVLAFACLKEIMSGAACFEILKPTQRLELYYYDITEMIKFSEGQRVTAAILIYSILVKMRQRQAGSQDGLTFDAGYLLLDNPLGKANHTALVDLQVRVADAMGLQLIYASGINDPGALVRFGHIIRLKNTALDVLTGDKLVQTDNQIGEVSAVEIGKYPERVIPPPPAKPAILSS